ncbi:S-adenosyl-L-methionine-dependent methyltransferase [Apodospora peruviana]|uniref:S-adenosyl-L-methionine-dependent methyltransferase n=1 Tax=Apodospora peruviana TaxID=516989 RepID=A0AAE0I6U4_9PEZI|nr:S-adenosyl-L-methionine-dependent methyltransferase [Apodospora peruviana]
MSGRKDDDAVAIQNEASRRGVGKIDASIASAPCDADSVPELIKDISQAQGQANLTNGREARLQLLGKARALVQALETPREVMLKHVGAETCSFFSVCLGIDIGHFKAMAQNDCSPKKVPEIASAVGFDTDGLQIQLTPYQGRILRHLEAMGHIAQTGPDEYAPNNFSKSLTIPIVADGYPFYRDVCIAPMLHLHKWYKTKSYATPTTGHDNPFTFGNTTALSMFEYMAASPTYMEQFNHHMGGYRLGRPAWFHRSVYPALPDLLNNVPDIEDPVVLVDIGGNRGHDLENFLASNSWPPNYSRRSTDAKFILQDQQAVLDDAPSSLDMRITKMPHDFFTPQPVHGARAYYLHHILHDWPDEWCEVIVNQIKGAMKPGYSRLLINEHVIPPKNANWEVTYLDLYMMTLFGSRERTEHEWRALLEEKCGLKIINIYNPGNGVEALIECEVSV